MEQRDLDIRHGGDALSLVAPAISSSESPVGVIGGSARPPSRTAWSRFVGVILKRQVAAETSAKRSEDSARRRARRSRRTPPTTGLRWDRIAALIVNGLLWATAMVAIRLAVKAIAHV